jgi:hypothetical protein
MVRPFSLLVIPGLIRDTASSLPSAAVKDSGTSAFAGVTENVIFAGGQIDA